MKAWGDESTCEAFRSNISCSGVFSVCFRWVLTPTLWRWEPLTEREREQARRGWLSYITFAAAAWHVCHASNHYSSVHYQEVCMVCVCMKDRERWCWECGLQSCPWVSGRIVIDCTAVAFNYVSIQSMQKAAGAQRTFLHSDYSCLLCGKTVLCFVVILHQLDHTVSFIWGCTMAQVSENQRMCIKVKSRIEDLQFSNQKSHWFSAQTMLDELYLGHLQGLNGHEAFQFESSVRWATAF